MIEIDFKKIEQEDKDLITHYFKHHTSRSCERTFVNVYLWARFYHVKFAVKLLAGKCGQFLRFIYIIRITFHILYLKSSRIPFLQIFKIIRCHSIHEERNSPLLAVYHQHIQCFLNILRFSRRVCERE